MVCPGDGLCVRWPLMSPGHIILESEKTESLRWCRGTGQPLSVKLLVAAGGASSRFLVSPGSRRDARLPRRSAFSDDPHALDPAARQLRGTSAPQPHPAPCCVLRARSSLDSVSPGVKLQGLRRWSQRGVVLREQSFHRRTMRGSESRTGRCRRRICQPCGATRRVKELNCPSGLC
jgi:hypothetical protein